MKRVICALVVSIMILWTFSCMMLFAVNADETVGDLNGKESRLLDNISFTLLMKEPQKSTVSCFDVNENEMIAVGSGDLRQKTVCIYDKTGKFQYGFSFRSNGSFKIKWNKDNVIVYLLRGDHAFEVNSSGISDCYKKSTDGMNELNSKVKHINGNTYILKKKLNILTLFASDYSQIVLVDENNETTVLYDVSLMQTIKMCIILALIFGFIIFVLLGFIFQIRQNQSGKGSMIGDEQ